MAALVGGCPTSGDGATLDDGTGPDTSTTEVADDTTTSPDATADTATDSAATDSAATDSAATDSAATDSAATDSAASDTRVDAGDTHETSGPSQAMRLHVLDVGQGEAIIVELPCGAMLVDTGGEVTEPSADGPGFDSVEALETQVRAFFTSRPDLKDTFDLVVLTHPHVDHTRGVTRLLEMVQAGDLVIDNVVTNGAEGSSSGAREQRALHDHADASPAIGRWYVLQRTTGTTGISNEVIDPFPACTRDGATLDPRVVALWGRVDDQSPHYAAWDDADLFNDNNHSVVLRVDLGEASVLLTGDLEEAGIAALVAQYAGTTLLDVDLYKAGHHGSHNGTSPALVNAMTPRVAVMSSGPADRVGDWTAWAYGHPRWSAVSDMLGDSNSVGVSEDRPSPVDVPVASYYADGHGVFETRRVAPAVYNTGWEHGAVVITLRSDGTLELP